MRRAIGLLAIGTLLIAIGCAPRARVQFAYATDAINDENGTISAYTINATSGALTPLPGAPFAAGSSPVFLAVDSTGKFAYVANATTASVSAYTIDPTSGALTPVAGSPFAPGTEPTCITFARPQ